MSDSDGTPTLVGQYSASAPALDPSFFSDLDSIEAVVNDIVYNAGGSKASLHSNTTAEAWYRLETDVKAAEAALADINDRFAKEIKAMRDALEGDSGDAFNKYATAILKTSEEIYSTLMQKQFATNMGNIGHFEQAFANNWWQLHDAADSSLNNMVDSLQSSASNQIQAATDVNQINQISAQLAADIADACLSIKDALLKDLQGALGNLGKNYNDIGGYLVPLYISDGDTTTAAPSGSFQQQVNQPHQFYTSSGQQDTDQNQQQQFYTSTKPPSGIEDTQLDQGDSQSNTEDATVPSTQGEVTPLQTTGSPTDQVTPPDSTMTGLPADTTGSLSGTTGSSGESTGGSTGTPAEGTSNSQSGVSPQQQQQQALKDARDAAGQAIDGLSAQTNDPEQQQALDDAKSAAQGAIDGLANPPAQGTGDGAGDTGSTGDTSGSGEGQQQPGVAGAVNPAAQQALADAKKAAGNAIDGLAGQSSDPKRTKALEDAKKAAEGAIDGLTDPTALPPGQLAGGPSDSKLEAAKDAAGKAIDDLAKPGDSEARQKALDDAKRAATDAVGNIGDVGGQGGGADGTDGAGAAGQQDRGNLLEAKHAAQKAIDDLIGKTDDPERKQALEDAKNAMSNAIDKTAAPEHFKQVEDAKHAADKAIDGLREQGDDPQRQHALDAAKAAAEKAIGGINDASDLSGPGHEQALEQAKEQADKAIDALCKPDDTPAERQALAQAKEAVNKAIDGIGEDSGDATRQFLTSSGPKEYAPPQGGLDSVGGEIAGGPSGGGGGPLTGGGAGSGGTPSTQGGPPPGQFDTQPFQGGQQAAVAGTPAAGTPGQPATASGGAPMGPMGGGMGGGAGNQGEKEREPQIWMQADKGAWGDDESDEPRSHVLGRS